MRFAPAAIGTGALVTAVATTVVWAVTGSPPACTVSPGATVGGDGWELSGPTLVTAGTGANGAAPDAASYVVVEFELSARDPLNPDQLGCSVEFRAGGLAWRPDNAALPLGNDSGCYSLEPGPNRVAYSVTVPSGVAAEVVAEVTVVRRGDPGGLAWFQGESVLRIAR